MNVRLNKNLRRQVLRGHPWVYRDALEKVPDAKKSTLCQVFDQKGQPLAWAMFDPHSPLALRIVGLKKAKPNDQDYMSLLKRARDTRESILPAKTNAYRMINGEGDLLPGMVCDIYNETAVLQFDGQGPGEFWNKKMVSEWILENTKCKSVVEKPRGDTEAGLKTLAGDTATSKVTIQENGIQFVVDIEYGQKTGFFSRSAQQPSICKTNK